MFSTISDPFQSRMSVPDQLVPKPSIDVTKFRRLADNEYIINDANPFVGRKHKGREYCLIWNSTIKMDAIHVEQIANIVLANNESLHINTGTHGDENGRTSFNDSSLAESKFLEEDIRANFTRRNVSIHAICSECDAIYPKRANHVINAWCNSIKNPATAPTAPTVPIDEIPEIIKTVDEELYEMFKKTAELQRKTSMILKR